MSDRISELEKAVIVAAMRWSGRLFTPVLSSGGTNAPILTYMQNADVQDALDALTAERQRKYLAEMNCAQN